MKINPKKLDFTFFMSSTFIIIWTIPVDQNIKIELQFKN